MYENIYIKTYLLSNFIQGIDLKFYHQRKTFHKIALNNVTVVATKFSMELYANIAVKFYYYIYIT